MTKEKTWTPFPWYCPNCGTLVVGYKNTAGIAKVQCETCGALMVRKWKGKKQDTLYIFDWSEEEFLVAEDGPVPRDARKSENPVQTKANRVSRK